MNVKKYAKKLAYQEKVNPGHKKNKYIQPPRCRSTIFDMKVKYSRSKNKKICKETIYDY